MSNPYLALRSMKLGVLVLPALLTTGCVTVSSDQFRNMLNMPTPAIARPDQQIQQSVQLEIVHKISPEVQKIWHNWGNTDETIENFRLAVVDRATAFLIETRMFATLPGSGKPAEYVFRVESEEIRPDGFGVRLNATMTAVKSGEKVFTWNRESKVDGGQFTYQSNMPKALAKLLDEARAGLTQQWAGHLRQTEEQRNQFLTLLQRGPLNLELFELQPRKEYTIPEWTNLILSWKNNRLDEILRSARTAELRAATGRIEQTILEATDQSEKERDLAQRAVSNGQSSEQAHLDLSRAYRLRIEVLRPILASLRGEVVNRER